MRAWLILNGKKAGRTDVREAVVALRRQGYSLEVRVTWEQGDGVRMVAEAAREGVERVIAGGGDGSLHEIANGLMQLGPEQQPALGILPLGTANDFATCCRIPMEPLAALRLALTGRPQPVDLGRANKEWFVNVASGGFGASVTAETPVELKNFLGGGAYTLMGLFKAVNFRPYACTIRTPAGEMAGSVVVGAICNGRQAGGGQPLAPAARINDGLLDVVFLRPFAVADAAQGAAEMATTGSTADHIVRLRTPWIETESHDPIPVNLDGEPVSSTHFRFEVAPAAIRMVLPPDCPCL